jgi:selenocysteine-specific translation elongation factor
MNDFLNRLLAQVIAGVIVAALVFVITLPFKNTLEQLTALAVSIERSVTAITEAANIDPAQIQGVSEAVATGSEVISEGFGNGAANAIGRIRGALDGQN